MQRQSFKMGLKRVQNAENHRVQTRAVVPSTAVWPPNLAKCLRKWLFSPNFTSKVSIAPNLVVRKSQKSRFHLISCSLTRQSITFSLRVGYSCSVIRRLGLSMNDVNAYCVFLVGRFRPKTETSCQKDESVFVILGILARI